tara:strand:+ start:834 stop:1004 length:171 start_codon:yes stop_codon:yes gene_type:complete
MENNLKPIKDLLETFEKDFNRELKDPNVRVEISHIHTKLLDLRQTLTNIVERRIPQ